MFKRCKHKNKRCLHGDEITRTWRVTWGSRRVPFARVRCVDCDKALYKEPLPEICSYNNEPHVGNRSYR